MRLGWGPAPTNSLPATPGTGVTYTAPPTAPNIKPWGYATPVTASAGAGGVATVDSTGSPFHLPPSWFNGGSSAQQMPTGGPGLGTPGVATPDNTGGWGDWLMQNLVWVALGLFVVILLYLALRK